MAGILPGKLLSMSGPAVYRIIVRGNIDPSWERRLGGMSISRIHPAEGVVDTVLVGRLPDQAALSGVLNTLYELHCPVVSADWLESD